MEARVDAILLGIGRQPNVDGLGLDAAGVAYDMKDGVTVDDRLRTTNKRIYAAGDVCSPLKFTHAADAMARIVIRAAGWDDTAMYHAVAVTALFNLMNRLVEGLGIEFDPAYVEPASQRLAERGYLPLIEMLKR